MGGGSASQKMIPAVHSTAAAPAKGPEAAQSERAAPAVAIPPPGFLVRPDWDWCSCSRTQRMLPSAWAHDSCFPQTKARAECGSGSLSHSPDNYSSILGFIYEAPTMCLALRQAAWIVATQAVSSSEPDGHGPSQAKSMLWGPQTLHLHLQFCSAALLARCADDERLREDTGDRARFSNNQAGWDERPALLKPHCDNNS